MSDGPCCDDCYGSHGDCTERGTCFCHRAYDAEEAAYVWCTSRRAADELIAAVGCGLAQLGPAVVVVGKIVRTHYPDGGVRDRRLEGARCGSDNVVFVRLGEVLRDAAGA